MSETDAFLRTRGSAPRSRYRPMLVTLLVGAVGIVATMAIATVWARDLPKTVAFAIAREPFGERSMLDTDNALAGLERTAVLVPEGDRIVTVTLSTEKIVIRSIDADGLVHVASTDMAGDTDSFRAPNGVESGEGITPAQFAAIDVTTALAAAQVRARELEALLVPPLERLEGPWVSLEATYGDPHWVVEFISDVPEDDRAVSFGLDGRPLR